MSALLTKARVERLAVEITEAGEFSRRMDPLTQGSVCYPAMCGVLESVICRLVEELAGAGARKQIAEAFQAGYNEVPKVSTTKQAEVPR